MISNGQTVVQATATLIDGYNVNPVRIHIHNNDNTNNVFIGDQNVTINTGLLLQKLDSVELILNPLEGIYAVSANGGHIVSWLKQTVE